MQEYVENIVDGRHVLFEESVQERNIFAYSATEPGN